MLELLYYAPGEDVLTRTFWVDGLVRAGFPSPADDFRGEPIDLNRELAKNPDATFFVRVAGCSMTGCGIEEGDVLVVDRSVEPLSGMVVICAIAGEFTVKQLQISGGKIRLKPYHGDFEMIEVEDPDDFQVVGVVTYVIHKP